MGYYKPGLQTFVNANNNYKGECGKICFDKKTAETKRNWLLKRGREKNLRIYNCPFCNCWHLTKAEKDEHNQKPYERRNQKS